MSFARRQFFRLGSALARQGKTTEALAAYEDLVAFGTTPVAGNAAELVARRHRAELLARLGDADKASAERKMLAALLSEGRHTLDRTTFELYSEGVPPLPSACREGPNGLRGCLPASACGPGCSPQRRDGSRRSGL